MSFVPMAAVNEKFGMITAHEDRRLADVSKGFTAFENGDVLFAKITPCMENGKAALAHHLTNGVGRGSTEFYVLRPGDKILGEYVYHFVRQPGFREKAKRYFTGTAGQQRVPKSFMENVPISFPPLDEQRQIVDILNRAARIKRLHERRARYLRDFTSALFVKMFGDPFINSMRYPIAKLGHICTIVGGGTPKRSQERYFGGTIPWATPTDVTALYGLFIKHTKETITEAGLKESSARLVPKGTVLLTSRATIGYTAIASKTMATNQGFANLICGPQLRPEYLAYWLYGQRNLLVQLSGGTTFKEISKSTLKTITIPVPPISHQEKFAALIEITTRIGKHNQLASESAANLLDSLMDRLLGTH